MARQSRQYGAARAAGAQWRRMLTHAASCALLVMIVLLGACGPNHLSAAATKTPSATANTQTPSATAQDQATATTGTGPFRPGTVLYQANFSSPNNIYQQWDGDILSGGIGWSISGGALRSSGNSTGEWIWERTAIPTANYAVEAHLRVLALPDGKSFSAPAFGLVVRGKSTDIFTGYVLGVSGLFVLDTAKLDYQGTDGPVDRSEAHYVADTNTHVYRVEAQGQTIRLFIDNTRIFEDTDPANLFPAGGEVGFTTQLLQVEVTDFRVIAL